MAAPGTAVNKTTILKNPRLGELEQDLLDGRMSLREIGSKFGYSQTAVMYHRNKYLTPRIQQQAVALSLVEPGAISKTRERIDKVGNDYDFGMDAAKSQRNLRAIASLLPAGLRHAELLGNLTGELRQPEAQPANPARLNVNMLIALPRLGPNGEIIGVRTPMCIETTAADEILSGEPKPE